MKNKVSGGIKDGDGGALNGRSVVLIGGMDTFSVTHGGCGELEGAARRQPRLFADGDDILEIT